MKSLNIPIPRFVSFESGMDAIGFNKMISVRSSPHKSMPGILKTVLNIDRSNKKQLREAYKIVFDSFYTKIADLYRKKFNIEKPETPQIIFQEMVSGLGDNSGAGIFYTKSPNLLNNKIKSICVFKKNSSGDDVVNGIDAKDSLKDLHPKEYKKLVRYGKELEYKLNHPQDIEFVIDEGKLWILQTRDVVFSKKNAIQLIREDEIKTLEPITPGVGTGRISKVSMEEDFILFTKNLFINESISFDKCKGIISLTGNKLCHAAILSRKYEIPCIIGNVEDLLNEKISIDGTSGKIFMALNE